MISMLNRLALSAGLFLETFMKPGEEAGPYELEGSLLVIALLATIAGMAFCKRRWLQEAFGGLTFLVSLAGLIVYLINQLEAGLEIWANAMLLFIGGIIVSVVTTVLMIRADKRQKKMEKQVEAAQKEHQTNRYNRKFDD